ncbi:MAG: hypothetical protein H0V26_04610 [Solirubrobacterales bacterium]|nr:hypothetical protein [Solirubrobacterales bacterium]
MRGRLELQPLQRQTRPLRTSTNVYGTNPDLSRRVARSADGAVFLVPGDGGICMVTTRSETVGGRACVTTGTALRDGLTFTQAATRAGGRRVEGVVPDGVARVELSSESESRLLSIDVCDNGFSIGVTSGEATTLRWLGESNAVMRELPVP